MAYEPKKGRFNYNLASVLKVRHIFEKKQQDKYREAERKHREEIEKEKQILEFQEKQVDDLKQTMQGTIGSVNRIFMRQNYLVKVKKDVEDQQEVTKKSEKKKENERKVLIERMKDRQIMEKDRENKRKIWKRFMNKEETKFLDDIASSRFFKDLKARKAEQAKHDQESKS